MTRALDNINEISTGQLKQRRHELISELALVNKENKAMRQSIIADYAKVIFELDKR